MLAEGSDRHDKMLVKAEAMRDRLSSILSNLGRIKGEDNAIFRYDRSDKFICDAIFNPIIVNPDFLMADFGMDDTAMNSSVIFPAFVYQHKVVALAKLSEGIAADDRISNHITITSPQDNRRFCSQTKEIID
jgi:hypothetical protein